VHICTATFPPRSFPLPSYFPSMSPPPFLSVLSALPFLLIKIYSHNLLLLSSGSERLIGNFGSEKTTVQGEEMDAANLRAPCRYHGNTSTRGAGGSKGRKEREDMIKSEHSILIWRADVQVTVCYYHTLPHPFGVRAHACKCTRVFEKQMHAHGLTLCTATRSICASLITRPRGSKSIWEGSVCLLPLQRLEQQAEPSPSHTPLT